MGIAGPNQEPSAWRAAGDIYAANLNSVTVYTPDAAGDATPIATIVGANTGLTTPACVAVGPIAGIFASR